MAQKTTKTQKKYKLNLWSLLSAADTKKRKFFQTLDDEQAKEFNPYMPQRWLTNLTYEQEGLSEYIVRNAALHANKGLKDLGSEHKELQYLLLTTITPDPISGLRHSLIKPLRRVNGSENRINILSQIYPSAKISDLDVMLGLMTEAEFKELLEDHGINSKDF
jgi:hypothetical protein